MVIDSGSEEAVIETETGIDITEPEDSIRYAATRLVFVIGYFLNILTFGLTAYIFAPMVSYLFFGDIRFWRQIHKFHRLTISSYRHLFTLFRDRDYGDAFHLRWTVPPRSAPDLDKVSVKDSWMSKNGPSCNGCISCCELIKCELIDKENAGCLVYDTPYWRYFNCGRFPENQRQIDYFRCTKWQMDQ